MSLGCDFLSPWDFPSSQSVCDCLSAFIESVSFVSELELVDELESSEFCSAKSEDNMKLMNVCSGQ